MAAVDILPQSAVPQSKHQGGVAFKPIIDTTTAAKRKFQHVDFDPEQHLAFEPPKNVVMMKELGFPEDTGVSPVAVSEPFRLFSGAAIEKFREEVLSEEVMAKYSFKSTLAACQIRGYAPKHAPFIYDAWHNPEVLSIVSKVAGVDLVPNMNFEIGHVNISVKSDKEAREERAAVEREQKSFAEDEGIAGCPWEDDKPVVGWHHDSYPFVCVTMLSDCTNMVGGETALRTANGDVMKVRGPQMGCAVILQGRYITHQALRALGAQERITMVTSFRPKSPFLADDSVLDTVRGVSDLSELYYGFAEYRLEMQEERMRMQLKKLRDAHTAGKRTDVRALKAFLEEQERFLRKTNAEILLEEDVVVGGAPDLGIPDVSTHSEQGSPAKRAKKA